MHAGVGGGGSAQRGQRRRAGQHELEEHGADTVLYFSRAGDLDGVRRMVEADPTQVCGWGCWVDWTDSNYCIDQSVVD
jgi:hypothetical protein